MVYRFCVALVILACSSLAQASSCFIATANGKILTQKGDCTTRHPPGCDFSIVLSIMGFDSGVLKDENNPKWDYQEGYEAFFSFWKSPHTPRTWMLDSCAWYSGVLAMEIEQKKFYDYIQKFGYGNQDASGVTREDWTGALLISPIEQVEFLQKFVNHKLDVDEKAYEMTKKVIFIQDFSGGWKLYGKTWIGEGPGEQRTGWFVGWIEKDNRYITFASNVVHLKKQKTMPSPIAKNAALEKLLWLIHDLEK